MNRYTKNLIHAIDTEKKLTPPQGWVMSSINATKIAIIRNEVEHLDRTSDIVNYWAS